MFVVGLQEHRGTARQGDAVGEVIPRVRTRAWIIAVHSCNHICDPRTGEAEAGGSLAGWPTSQAESVSCGLNGRLCLKSLGGLS